MAVSAFKSTSKRSTATSAAATTTGSSTRDRPMDDTKKKIPIRRSRSVSAVSRPSPSPSASASDMAEFSNTRDNPLFSCSASPSSPEPANPRGRPASRNSGTGHQGSRSLSRAGAGAGRRNRSVSRGPYANSESDADHRNRTGSTSRKKEFDMSSEAQKLQTWSSRHRVNDSWDTSSSCMLAQNWEDGISTSSLSEPEETTIRMGGHPSGDNGIYETVRSEVRRAVFEIQNDLENAIQRKNPAIMRVENVVDFPPELANHDAIELVSDMRREYAAKLEQSQERARKLREDLAIEEQREQELSRILKEILPDPNFSGTRGSRPRRKASIERLKMSQRLTEEAMNYFDECVSISTFDSSDFSSQEEPLPSSVAGVYPMGSSRFFPSEGTNFSASHFSSGHLDHPEASDDQTQCLVSFAASDFGVSSNCSNFRVANRTHANGNHGDPVGFSKPWGGNFQFSFAHKPMENGVSDIRSYAKKFEQGGRAQDIKCAQATSSYSPHDYDQNSSAERLLFDKVSFRNRIESGGLLICDIRIF